MAISVASLCAGLGLFVGLWIRMPWGLDIALVVLPFFHAGRYVRESGQIRKIFDWRLGLPATIIFAYLSTQNGNIDIANRLYNDIHLFYANGIIGSAAVMWLTSVTATRIAPIQRILSHLGKNSLVILAFQTITIALSEIIMRKAQIDGAPAAWLIEATMATVFCICVAEAIGRSAFLRQAFRPHNIIKPKGRFTEAFDDANGPR